MDRYASSPLKRHPLASFFVLAYAIAWIPSAFGLATGNYSVLGISAFAPAISALIVNAANEGRTGIQALVSKLFLWRVRIKWVLIALLAPIVLELLAIPMHRWLGDAMPSPSFGDWIQILPAQLPALVLFLLFLVVLSMGEELGWRGYALPRLQSRYGAVWASLILGSLWGPWHLPTFWIPGSIQNGLPIPGYILATIGFTFIYTCLYNGSKGSVLLACLYHAASNLTLTYGNALFPKIIGNLYLSLPALAVLVIIVMALSGSNGLVGRQSPPGKSAA